jgi:hypothetical protein
MFAFNSDSQSQAVELMNKCNGPDARIVLAAQKMPAGGEGDGRLGFTLIGDFSWQILMGFANCNPQCLEVI